MNHPPLDEPSASAGAAGGLAENVAVVVVAPNALDAEFVDTLRTATRRSIELVHVCTDPSVGTPPLGGRILRVDPTLAYGAAVNSGVRDTTAEYVVVASPSIRWETGSLDELLSAARRWPTGAAFGPLITRPDGATYPSARCVPTLGHGIGHAVFGRWWPGNPWTRGYLGSYTGEERTAGWLSGSCLLLRRDAFDSVGGFDPGFVAFFEDVDLGERLNRAGWHNVYVPAACVRHVGVGVTGRETAAMTVEHHRSASRYLARRYAGWRWLPLRLVLRVGLAIRSRWARRGALDVTEDEAGPDGPQAHDTAA